MNDMNQAIAVLDATKHWRLQCENSATRGRHYSCKIWDGGRRVEAVARTPLMASEAALKKLKEPRRRRPAALPSVKLNVVFAVLMLMTTAASGQEIKVIAFDAFGTVFDLRSAERQDIRDYVTHVRADGWKPLCLPESWERMPAHPDSVEGIAKLREKYFVVTLSNGPLGLLAKMSKNAGVVWDAIIPLELNRVYKPNHRAYLTVCDVLGCKPGEVLMVTANKDFGDLEGSKAVGMHSVLIRSGDGPKTIIELAEQLVGFNEGPEVLPAPKAERE